MPSNMQCGNGLDPRDYVLFCSFFELNSVSHQSDFCVFGFPGNCVDVGLRTQSAYLLFVPFQGFRSFFVR